jgi:hypothetical protein
LRPHGSVLLFANRKDGTLPLGKQQVSRHAAVEGV